MEDERRNAAKAFNDRCGALEMTLDQLEKQIVKVHAFMLHPLVYFQYRIYLIFCHEISDQILLIA